MIYKKDESYLIMSMMSNIRGVNTSGAETEIALGAY